MPHVCLETIARTPLHTTYRNMLCKCLLCRYYTLGLKSVLRLPISGIGLGPSRRPFTHSYRAWRIHLRPFVLNSYKLRIVYALKGSTEGEIKDLRRGNNRTARSTIHTIACTHPSETSRPPQIYQSLCQIYQSLCTHIPITHTQRTP